MQSWINVVCQMKMYPSTNEDPGDCAQGNGPVHALVAVPER